MKKPQSEPVKSEARKCRRYQLDRRVLKMKLMSQIFSPGVRAENRRQADSSNFVYLDRHEPHLLFIASLVIVFSLVDAFLTLIIINTGGVELNFFADKLIGLGLYGFIFSKYLITAAGMIILILHKHYTLFFGIRVKIIIYCIGFIYISLVLYELFIIALFA